MMNGLKLFLISFIILTVMNVGLHPQGHNYEGNWGGVELMLRLFLNFLIALSLSLFLVLIKFVFFKDASYKYFQIIIIISSLIIGFIPQITEGFVRDYFEDRRRTQQLTKFDETFEFNYPSPLIKTQDSIQIVSAIQEMLMDFDFGDSNEISERDLLHYEKLKKFIPIGFGAPSKQISENSKLYNRLEDIVSSIFLRFICYSPDHKYFVSFLELESDSPFESFSVGAVVYLGERVNDEIHIYGVTRIFHQNPLPPGMLFHQFIAGWHDSEPFINNLKHRSLTALDSIKKSNMYDSSFWSDPTYFNEVKVGEKYLTRFKTFNMQNVEVIAYQEREHLVLK